ncbi:MAG: hypothetical protein JNK85_21185 [Verrucomicrobiales bacterium]|nr:hypothetical protein [Verrucomicrobiales bacterium]
MSDPDGEASSDRRWLRWIDRVWKSPTANTWVSLFSRSASLVLVLPLVLRNFTDKEAAVWFLFSAVIAVQGVLGFGFNPSFARLLAYARAGAEVEKMLDLRSGASIAVSTGINWRSIGRLVACMERVFGALALMSTLLMATVGTAAVWRQVGLAGHPPSIWIAWGCVAAGCGLGFLSTHYASILQGMDRLTEWRRAETVLSLGGIVSASLVLVLGGRILALTLTYQVWGVVSWWVYRRLARWSLGPDYQAKAGPLGWEAPVFWLVWNSAWKSGLAVLLTHGIIQATGVIQAQFGTPATTATYNFTLRVVTMISQVVQAPFLTKLPELARLRAVGDQPRQWALLRRGMMVTHWSIVLVMALGAVAMPFGLRWIGSQSVTFDPILWAFFATNLFFERHGGMLHQVRNLTNQPLEHIGVAGYSVTILLLMVLLHPWYDWYAYPLAMLGTQLFFAVWFNAAMAYPILRMRPLAWERTLALPPFFALMLINLILVWVAPSS